MKDFDLMCEFDIEAEDELSVTEYTCFWYKGLVITMAEVIEAEEL